MLTRERKGVIAEAFIEWLKGDQVIPFEEQMREQDIDIEEFDEWRSEAAKRIAEALRSD